MNLLAKARLSQFSLKGLLAVVCFYIVSIVVLLTCVAFGANPFKENMTAFLFAAFVGSLGLALCCLFLNIAANLSRIAEKESNVAPESSESGLKKWIYVTVFCSVVAVALVLLGDYYSKMKLLAITRKQADSVVTENTDILDQIAKDINSNNPESKQRAVQAIKFIGGQRRDLPNVMLVYPGKIGEKAALIRLSTWSSFKETPTDEYYECDQAADCSFLKKFFAGEDVGTLEWYNESSSSYDIYVPVKTANGNFVLKFSKTQRYGKFGS